MSDNCPQLLQKLWNYCNILRNDLSACGHAQAGGLSYLFARGLSVSPAQASAQASGDHPSAWSILGAAAFHAVKAWASILHAHLFSDYGNCHAQSISSNSLFSILHVLNFT